ncbi:uncharacterized protein LOC134234419 [Saccostrea cucullata]|uniref:uncharacterized protein LOC134234419 n=1 Tax=Saccostrea cuccullata TaxID=36930 RepID=UPI002ED1D3BD
MEQSMECSGLLLRPRIQIQNDENENIESSQETSMDTCSQESQVSEASISGIDRLSKLNEFLAACNKSPVKTLRESFVSSSQRTRRRYAAKANECLSILLETICPGESDALKDAMFSKLETSYTHYESPALIEALTESYLKAETPTIRRQILSVLTTQASFQDVNAMIPSVTQHKFYSAKKHARELGVGAPVPHEKQSREKVDSSKLEHFLDFITSSHVIKDLPLGEKTLTLTTGELIQTPHVIRCLAPATIVRQYSQLCIEENFEAIGQSTMYKILSVRRSVEGVDYYVAEASEAFRELEHVVQLRNCKFL